MCGSDGGIFHVILKIMDLPIGSQVVNAELEHHWLVGSENSCLIVGESPWHYPNVITLFEVLTPVVGNARDSIGHSLRSRVCKQRCLRFSCLHRRFVVPSVIYNLRTK